MNQRFISYLKFYLKIIAFITIILILIISCGLGDKSKISFCKDYNWDRDICIDKGTKFVIGKVILLVHVSSEVKSYTKLILKIKDKDKNEIISQKEVLHTVLGMGDIVVPYNFTSNGTFIVSLEYRDGTNLTTSEIEIENNN
jgi:hypothetical protein